MERVMGRLSILLEPWLETGYLLRHTQHLRNITDHS